MSETVSWILQVDVREGQADNIKSLMDQMVDATKAEEGATGYRWFIAPDKSSVHIYEEFASSAAVMAHLGTFSQVMDQFMAIFQPTALAVYGNPSAEARGALDGFHAQYFSWLGGFTK